MLLGLGKGGVWRRGVSPQGNQGTVSMGTESGYWDALLIALRSVSGLQTLPASLCPLGHRQAFLGRRFHTALLLYSEASKSSLG